MSESELIALGSAACQYPGASGHDTALQMQVCGVWRPKPVKTLEMVEKRIAHGEKVLRGLQRKGLVRLTTETHWPCRIWVATDAGRRAYRKHKPQEDE